MNINFPFLCGCRMSIEFYRYGRDQKCIRHVQFSPERHRGAFSATSGQLVAAHRKSIDERVRETRSEDKYHFILVFTKFRRRIEFVVRFRSTSAKE